MTYKIKLSFDAAHFLPNYDGKCKRMHGHTWRVTFFVAAPGELDASGIGIDFKVMRKALEALLPDHELLNDHLGRPSAEGLAKWLLAKAMKIQPGNTGVMGLELWESDGCGVEVWRGELEP